MKNYISNTFHSDDKAKAMRRSSTPAETTLWKCLRGNALGVHFRRQCPVGMYILDFYCHTLKLCIELDGDVHSSMSAYEYDSRRTAYLNGQGITVLRYDNSVVFENMEGIVASINAFIAKPRLMKGDLRNILL